jgi:hypothetical protein
MGNKRDLMDKLREVRSTLLSTTLGLTEARLATELVTDKWTIKDILGHIASWEEEFTKVVQKFINEEEPNYDYLIEEDHNWSKWNLAEWEKKRKLSFKQTVDEFLRAHECFIKVIEGISEQELSVEKLGSWGKQATIEQIILAQIEHELEHGHQILDWRKRQGM